MPPKSLFRGLTFCFHPKRTLYKLNAIKASAAARFGATIEEQPSAETTHVLVAPGSTKASFWDSLKSFPLNESCVVVSNDWSSDCIDANELINTDPYIVQPPGDTMTDRGSPSISPTISSRKSSASTKSSPDPAPRAQSDTELPGTVVDKGLKGLTRSPNVAVSPERRNGSGLKRASREDALRSPDWFKIGQNTLPIAQAKRRQVPSAVSLIGPSLQATSSHHRRYSGSDRSGTSDPNSSSEENSDRAGDSTDKDQQSNNHVIEVLRELAASRRANGQKFSAKAYDDAINVVDNSDSVLFTAKDGTKAGLTARMAQLVEDIRKGRLPPGATVALGEKARVLQLFSSVYGVGPHVSRHLYEKGYRTLEDIAPHVDDNGKVSIAHHEDFAERMSRAEVRKHFEGVEKLLRPIDPEVQAFCMGSYRRGQLDCGDVDIILTKEGASIRELVRVNKALLKAMFASGLALHTFSTGTTKWLGATSVVGKWRRMDILLVPWQELGAAMIYYTGNDWFNRRLRLKASKLGMRLNEKGLFRMDGDSRELVEGHDEHRIFELLHEKWFDPTKRNIR